MSIIARKSGGGDNNPSHPTYMLSEQNPVQIAMNNKSLIMNTRFIHTKYERNPSMKKSNIF